MSVTRVETCEIDQTDQRWMIQLARASKAVHTIVIKNFRPNPTSISFVKSISAENSLLVRSWEDDLVLQKAASQLSAQPGLQM